MSTEEKRARRLDQRAMVNPAKRSVVKHRTRSDLSSRPKNTGFHVGATNVPNGAYIGRGTQLRTDR